MLKIRKMSHNEIVVYLSDADLKFFDLDPDNIEPHSSDLHDFLFILMETVHDETGFDPYHGQVMVEAVPSESGLHITIRKIEDEKSKKKMTREQFRQIRGITAVSGNKDIKIGKEKRENQRRERTAVFVFECFIDLENAVCIASDDELKKSILLRFNKRYAIVTGNRPDMKYCNQLSEFAALSSKNSLLINDIKEGWKTVAEGEKLVEMANEMRIMR